MQRAEIRSSGSSSRQGWSLLETIRRCWPQLQALPACFPLAERWSREGSGLKWETSRRSDPRISQTRPSHHHLLRLTEQLYLLSSFRQPIAGQLQRRQPGDRMLAEQPVEGLKLSLGRPSRSHQSHHHPPQPSPRPLQGAESPRYQRVHQKHHQWCCSVSQALDQID